MEADIILNILSWVGGITGVALLLLLFVSSVLGADWDIDVDGDVDVHADIDADGSLGIIKSVLTFISVSSLTVRAIMLNSGWSWAMAIVVGVIAGVIVIGILTWLFKVLLSQQEDGSWEVQDALGEIGEVYLTIPDTGTGKINVPIKGVPRELDARSQSETAISNGTKVLVLDIEDSILIVTPSE